MFYIYIYKYNYYQVNTFDTSVHLISKDFYWSTWGWISLFTCLKQKIGFHCRTNKLNHIILMIEITRPFQTQSSIAQLVQTGCFPHHVVQLSHEASGTQGAERISSVQQVHLLTPQLSRHTLWIANTHEVMQEEAISVMPSVLYLPGSAAAVSYYRL